MEITAFILVLLLVIVLDIIGFVGSVAPAIPGPPLCLIGLAITFFYLPGKITTAVLVTMIVLCLIAVTIDYFSPMLVTKLGGGSKYAIIGSTLGIIVGVFFPPFGIIWIPFVCAFIGELVADFKFKKALKVALLSFLSFMLTTGFKLLLCGFISFISLRAYF